MSDDNMQDALADDWAAALAAQTEASESPVAPAAQTEASEPPAAAVFPPKSTGSSANVFKPLSGNGATVAKTDIDMILDIPVQLTAELGHTRITIKSLLQLAQGSVVELDGLAGEPMNVLINGYLIAQGEVVVVNDKFGIRLTDIITPSERIHKLNR